MYEGIVALLKLGYYQAVLDGHDEYYETID